MIKKNEKSIETKFLFYLQNKEREYARNITLDEISNDTSISIEKLNLMKESHFKSIDDVTIGEVSMLCDYFNVSINDFLIERDIKNMNQCDEVEISDTIQNSQLICISRCDSAQDVKTVIERSKYYSIYASVPTLIEKIAELIDLQPNKVIAGISENINIKNPDENVYCRLFAKKGKIYLKNVLFGKSIKYDKKALYKKVYLDYTTNKEKETVDDEFDVDYLIKLIKNVWY